MGVLDTAFNLSDDALGFEYQISIAASPLLPDSVNYTFRATTVEIPAVSIGEYTIEYKTETIVKPNGKITTPKEFSIEFRVDKYYALYKAFRLWHTSIVNPDTGGVAKDSVGGVSAIRLPIVISTGTFGIDGLFVNTLQSWTFTGCWPKEIGGFSLDNANNDPVLCSIRFGFLKML